MSYITYKGRDSREFSLHISSSNPFDVAQPEITTQSVPGRDGELVLTGNRYQNVIAAYQCFIKSNQIERDIRNIKSWILPNLGYDILFDSSDSDYFRYAYPTGKLAFIKRTSRLYEIEIEFSCKPFRYSFLGQKPIGINKTTTIYNPEKFASKPYIKVYGSGNGTLNINQNGWNFKGIDGYIELDSELMNTFRGTASQNQKVQGNGYPQLLAGKSTISFSGGISKIELIPRWCTL